MAVVVLGDLHLREDKDYFCEISEQFLSWFRSWKYNNSNNTLLLAGDLVESALLTGKVADYLGRLFLYSKFNSIHICVGNHDKHKYHDINQLAYEFYKNKQNVFIYEEATEVQIDDLFTLILPYYTGINKDGLTMQDYYSKIPNNKNFKNNYDLIVGHCCGEDVLFPGNPDRILNLDKFQVKKIIFGHIHTRNVSPEKYIGSIFANKKSENDFTRAALIYENKAWKEEYLPVFNEFITVSYPDHLPETKALVPIYTVLNCSSESVAKSKYGNIFIKKVTTDLVDFTIKKSDISTDTFNGMLNTDLKSLWNLFTENKKDKLTPDIIKDCSNILGIV